MTRKIHVLILTLFIASSQLLAADKDGDSIIVVITKGAPQADGSQGKPKVTISGVTVPTNPANPNVGVIGIPDGKGLIIKVTPAPGHKAQLTVKAGTTKVYSSPDNWNNVVPIGADLVLNSTPLLNNDFSLFVQFSEADAGPANLSLHFQRENSFLTSAAELKDSDAPTFYLPGNIYYDALALVNPNTKGQEWDNILRYYQVVQGTNSHNDILQSIPTWKNTFLKDAFSNLAIIPQEVPGLKAGVQGGNASAIQGLLSGGGIGGLDVTTIADGLAKFLVKRAKEELAISFFEKFKDILKQPAFVDLPTLFPETDSLILEIESQIYDYNRYIQNLNSAFKADLKSLPEHLPGIITNHPSFFQQRPAWASSLRSACYIAAGFQNNTHPGDILALYPLDYLNGLKDSINFKAGIRILQVLSAACKDSTTGAGANYWVNIGQIRSLVSNKRALEVFLGLITQKMLNNEWEVKFEGNKKLSDIMLQTGTDYSNNYDAWNKFILSIGVQVDGLENLIKQNKTVEGDSAHAELYAAYFRQTVDFLRTAVSAFKLPYIKDVVTEPAWFDQLDKYFNTSYDVADVVSDIYRRDYSGVINHVVHIYTEWTTQPAEPAAGAAPPANSTTATRQFVASIDAATPASKMESNLNKVVAGWNANPQKPAAAPTPKPPASFDIYVANLKKLYGDAIVTDARVDSLKKAYNEGISDKSFAATQDNDRKRVRDALIFYGGFIASMATAKTSDDVEKTLETYALPVGSSRIKRTAKASIALNGYIGPYFGGEKIQKLDPCYTFNAWGITAPIGVSFNLSSPGGFSHSLFVSVIDLGAVAAYRFTDDATESVPTIQLKDIVSPGVFYSLGLPKVPISLNIGYQSGPLLRKVNAPANEYKDKYGRISFSAVVDIPIFNLSTSKKDWNDPK